MYDYGLALEAARKRKRRRGRLLVGIVVMLVLLGFLASLAALDEPDFAIQSMSVERIDAPQRTLHLLIVVSVDNNNNIGALLQRVEGTVSSGAQKIGDFVSDESVEIPPNSNFTVQLDVAIHDAPLPLPSPVLVVEGDADIRAWVLGITYHFSHQIPLTYSPDQQNVPPVANIDAPRFARRDRPAVFDGSNSYDPDGRVVGWSWDFGDGQRADGVVVEHSFLAAGVYEVSLVVVDQMGEQSRTSTSIRVLPL